MRILVTGSTGFIGEELVAFLLGNGHDVVATSSDPKKAITMSWYSQVDYKPYTIAGEDTNNLFEYFNRPDVVIHLAWDKLHDYKGVHHIAHNLPNHQFFIKNLIVNGAKNINITGTCFEYGKVEGVLHEDLVSHPVNSYAIAKNTFYHFVDSLKTDYDFSLKWIRLFYIYGKSKGSNSLFAQLDLAINKGDEIFNMSKGDQLRDFLHIEEVVKNISTISLQKEVDGIINCCSGEPIRVVELVRSYLMQRGSDVKLNLGYYPYSEEEGKHFWGDNKKLKSIGNV